MASTDQIKQSFTKIGGKFVTPPAKIIASLKNIKAFVFDWDGVFNNGTKGENGTSIFSEVDSMGTNLLRFSHYYKTQHLPFTAIISGEKNSAAFYLSTREHFHSSYYKVANKIDALHHFCFQNNLKEKEVAFVFDDVLDLSVAEAAGLRIFIQRKANPLFNQYVSKNKLADYVTGSESGDYAVREACELIMGLNGTYDKVINERMHYTKLYEQYGADRNKVQTRYFTRIENTIIEQKP